MQFLFLIGVLVTPLFAIVDLDPNCVAYEAEKRMFFVSKVVVVGKSCELNSRLDFSESGYVLELRFPASSFDSGEEKRDKDVIGMLSDAQNPNIEFRSQSFTQEDWNRWRQEEQFTVKGHLVIRGKKYEVAAPVRSEGASLHGVIETSFKNLGLEPPTVAAGVVAKVSEPLKLHFRLVPEKVSGYQGSALDE